MMGMACRLNPTAEDKRGDTLGSGFLRYEHALASLPATAYVGLGHSQRYPDYWELFSAANQVGKPTAYETVAPEKTTQLDVGLQYRDGPIHAWVSAYAGEVRDYILFSYGPGASPLHTISWVNNIDARIAGAELGGSYRLTDNWKGMQVWPTPGVRTPATNAPCRRFRRWRPASVSVTSAATGVPPTCGAWWRRRPAWPRCRVT